MIAMGARPVALLDGLWFGEPDFHFQQAVAGIGHYGNSRRRADCRRPDRFDPAYASNCLVNAMCVGLLESDRLRSAKASGPGRIVVLYGATTGRDGIGGASVLAAPSERGRRRQAAVGPGRRPVHRQEADRGLARAGRVGPRRVAPGLRRSRSRLGAVGDGRGRRGPRRPPRPRAAPRRRDGAVGDHDLGVARADGGGRPAGDARRGARRVRALGAALHGDRRGDRLGRAEGVPRRRCRGRDPRESVDRRVPALRGRAARGGAAGAAPRAAGVRRGRSDRAVRPPRRLAHRPPARPRRRRPAPAAVTAWARRRASGPAPGETDGFRAGVQATLGAARNVACAGGEPIGLTDCLNFGNPEKPAIAHELAQAIEGIAQAAEALGIPVVSGNVSLYNDADGASIPPTPVVGCVGLVPDVRRVPAHWQRGDAVLLAVLARGLARGGDSADPLPLEGGAASDPLPRRRQRRGRGGPRGGRGVERRSRGRRRAPCRLRFAAQRGDPRLPPGAREPPRLARLRPRSGRCISDVRRLRRRTRPTATSRGSTYFGLFALQHRGQESAGHRRLRARAG